MDVLNSICRCLFKWDVLLTFRVMSVSRSVIIVVLGGMNELRIWSLFLGSDVMVELFYGRYRNCESVAYWPLDSFVGNLTTGVSYFQSGNLQLETVPSNVTGSVMNCGNVSLC